MSGWPRRRYVNAQVHLSVLVMTFMLTRRTPSCSPTQICKQTNKLNWQTKLTGGWKVIQDVCPECDEEDNGSVDSRNSRFSRRSVASRGGQKPESNDYNKSSSSGKGKSAAGSGNKGSKRSPEGGTRSGVDHSASSQSEHFRTKLDKVHTTTEENGEDGNRSRTSREKATKKDKLDNKGKSSSKSSYKNETSSSNATTANRGNSKNNDVTDREVNDATTPKYQRQRSQRALKEYKDLYESAKVVKNMVFVDVHGDSGRYTGDVNEFRMPHGMGNIIYEHGLVQGGKWVSTLCDCIFLFIRYYTHNFDSPNMQSDKRRA